MQSIVFASNYFGVPVGNSSAAMGTSAAATGTSSAATGNSAAATGNSTAATGNSASFTGNSAATTGNSTSSTANSASSAVNPAPVGLSTTSTASSTSPTQNTAASTTSATSNSAIDPSAYIDPDYAEPQFSTLSGRDMRWTMAERRARDEVNLLGRQLGTSNSRRTTDFLAARRRLARSGELSFYSMSYLRADGPSPELGPYMVTHTHILTAARERSVARRARYIARLLARVRAEEFQKNKHNKRSGPKE
uniref:Uncharacterized protein n=1 Tax=Mycena chlorophos TaxID=658473 RepID=A0ABQ0KV43_MYCCL|nr:predicted protein [Mycena chlorophos]